MTFAAGALFAACTTGDDEQGGNNGGGGSKGFPTDVVVDDPLFTGTVKAGYAGVVEITGEGFDPDFDYVKFGWEEDGKIVYSVELSPAFVLIKRSRITLGVHVADPVVGKTVKVYLDRIGYDPMPVSDEIEFVLPEVSEGYIPDAGFRETLMSTHPQDGNADIAPMFNEFGLIAPAQAATVKKMNLYATTAQSLEGIELFTNMAELFLWHNASIQKVDLSKLKGQTSVFVSLDGALNVREVITGPSLGRLDCQNCPKLERVDVHLSSWQYNFQMYYDNSETGYTFITYLDMRKDRSGKEFGGPVEADEGAGWKGYASSEPDGHNWMPLVSGSYIKTADNAHILLDYQFLLDKWVGGGSVNATNPDGSCYGSVFNAWKRGAKIDVYSSQDIEKFLGTVPMYADDPTALTPPGQENGWAPDEVE